MNSKRLLAIALAAALSGSAMTRSAQPQGPAKPTVVAATRCTTTTPLPPDSSCHVVTVTFNYDFSRTPSCSAKVTKGCVIQFNVYDISQDVDNPGEPKHPVELFTIAAQPGQTKPRHGLTGKSDHLLFANGRHAIAVTAATAGSESLMKACTTWIDITAPPANPAPATN